MKAGYCVTGVLTFAMLAAAGAPAMAQDGVAADSDVSSSGGIAEIVVTAQKREENLQDTPISIVALGSDALEQRGIGGLGDLFSGAIPSLRISPQVGRATVVTVGMRGLTPGGADQVTRDPAVGIYIDGVYNGRMQGLSMELSDIERIEVLRGPQGTLFGRNTIGGAVSIVTKKPTGQFSADVRAGIGNYDDRSVAAHVNLPSIAGVSIKLDGLFHKRGGLVLNPNPAFHDYSEIRKYGFKGAALWEPADNVSVLYSYDQSHDSGTANYSDIIKTEQLANKPAFVTVNAGRVRTARIGVPVLAQPQRSRGHSLVADWDVSDHLTIRSISAWRDLKTTMWDQDVGWITTWGPNRNIGRLSYSQVKQNQFSQEIQLVGEAGDFKYVFGGYYFNENASDAATAFTTARINATNDDIILFPEPVPSSGVGNTPDRASRVNVKSKALFGQVTWSPAALAGLHMTVGARYTDDHKNGRLTAIRGVDPNLDFVFNSGRIDPMATLAYDISRDIHAYVKVSRAYRAGGSNTRSFDLNPFGEEHLVAWEAGMKADLFDRHARLNIAAYTSVLSNQQVDFVNPAFISNTETVNVRETRRLQGVEIDIQVAPVRDLLFSVGYVYTDAPISNVRNPFTGAIEEVSSNYTPKHALTLTGDYTFPRFSFGELRIHADANTAGNYIPSVTIKENVESVFLVNGRLTLGDIAIGGGAFDIALWGKNLTNAKYANFSARQPGTSTSAYYNEPRTYGLEARVRF